MTVILNKLRNMLVVLANAVLELLPDSPFQSFISSFKDIPALGYLNYFVPVSEMIVITEVWLTAIIIFYAYQLLLRWIKLVG